LIRPQEALNVTFTGTPVEGTPATKAVVDSDVLPADGRFINPAETGERLKLAAETEKST
jgi:hypothetical protein